MGELILIRHGETEWSRSGQHTSWTDLPLTELGERQARALVPLLAEREIGLTLVSPYLRARRTAELAGLTEPRETPDLREWDYGAYEGITTVEIRRTRPDWNLWTDGVAPGPEEHPGRARRRSATGRTASWPRSARRRRASARRTSPWSPTHTSCACSPPATCG